MAAAATAVEHQLVYQDEVFINFRNDTYEWVSIKLFTLPKCVDDRVALELLLGHVRYRDSYAGTGDKDMKDIHGPYRLEAITPDSFSAVAGADAEALLRTWAEYYAPLPQLQREQMERELYARIRGATSRYQLADLRQTAGHFWGWVVGFVGGFYEFVLIDRRAGVLALVVASDD